MFSEAIAQRASLLTPATNALRLIDGAGDGVPGAILDTFADRWLVSTPSPKIPADFLNWVTHQPQSVYHKRLDQKEKESPTHLSGPVLDAPFSIRENGLSYEISFSSGYSQGIFLDQRDNRAEVIARGTSGQSILNTFSYTGAFSVCAASAGATSTTLDLSQPYLDWAKRNMELNQLDPAAQYFCKGDTFHWLARFGKQQKQFDGIILDPPTFARDHKGKVFRIATDYGRLVELALGCLKKDGWILACTNYRQMSDMDFQRVIQRVTGPRTQLRSAPMPADYTDEAYLKSVWIER